MYTFCRSRRHLRLLLALVLTAVSLGSRAQCEDCVSWAVTPSTCIDIKQCGAPVALIFVHGVFGDGNTFQGAVDWPKYISETQKNVDVFTVTYQTNMVSGSHASEPSFTDMSVALYCALTGERATKCVSPMKLPPLLRSRGYEVIGFIAHSLGGNLVLGYLSQVTLRLGFSARARHAFAITLGTPAGGAHIANAGSFVKSILGMEDKLLEALKKDSQVLELNLNNRAAAVTRSFSLGCRPTSFYAAIETGSIGPIQVVPKDSARLLASIGAEIKEFSLNHGEMARPPNSDEGKRLIAYVDNAINAERTRIGLTPDVGCRDAQITPSPF